MKNMNIMEGPMMSNDKFIKTKKSVPVTGPEVFQKFFKMNSEKKIKMDYFKDSVYSKSSVEHDKDRVIAFMNSPEYEKPTPSSIVLENIVSHLGDSNEWFLDKNENLEGYSCQLSEFDDKMADGARADMALEIKTPEGEIVRLLIDVTTSVDTDKLYKKRKKCIEKIEEGKLHSVKYFQSEITNKIGRQGDFPMVVVGMDKESLHEFCARAAEKKDLSNDYAMFMFLDEIVTQLETYAALSVKKNGENSDVTKNLLKTLKTFSDILETKNNLRPHDFEEKVVDDQVYAFFRQSE